MMSKTVKKRNIYTANDSCLSLEVTGVYSVNCYRPAGKNNR